MLATLELSIGAGMLNDRWRNTAAMLGAAFALAVWVTTQGIGGLTTGQATDPNSGPLLALLAAALLEPATGRAGLTDRTRKEPTCEKDPSAPC